MPKSFFSFSKCKEIVKKCSSSCKTYVVDAAAITTLLLKLEQGHEFSGAREMLLRPNADEKSELSSKSALPSDLEAELKLVKH